MKKYIAKIMLLFSIILFIPGFVELVFLTLRMFRGDFYQGEWWELCIVFGCSFFFLGFYRIIDILEKKQ
jgi:hypothetical protein